MLACTRTLFRSAKARRMADLSGVPAEAQPAFRLLKVTPFTSPEEIKQRYRTLARSHHPDVNSGDDSKMKEVNKAYASVLRHLMNRAGTDEDPRPQPSAAGRRGGKAGKEEGPSAAEGDLLSRLASWLRQGSPDEDPTARYREFVQETYSPGHDERTVLGTEEDEIQWAERWLAARDRRLGIKNQWRQREPGDNPFDEGALASLPSRLENLSVTDTLYWRRPLVPPTPPPELLAGGRRSGDAKHLLRRKRQRQLEHFHKPGGGAERFVLQEQREHEKEERERIRKNWERTRDIARSASGSEDLMLRSLRDAHETMWMSVGPKTAPSDLIDNELQSRPPRGARHTGKLMSFTTKNQFGQDKRVVMSQDAYDLHGPAYLGDK
eukprot:Hpha_TRINITY_DN34084_c0_g1::TRINITY_DN34084_c0_g1_i1::g.30497::m.30497